MEGGGGWGHFLGVFFLLLPTLCAPASTMNSLQIQVRTKTAPGEEREDLHGGVVSCLAVAFSNYFTFFILSLRDICDLVHEHGGQVYLDGANLNAQVRMSIHLPSWLFQSYYCMTSCGITVP